MPVDHAMLQLDLFEQPVVAGLAFQPYLITREAEAARIDAVDLTPFKFQGWLGRRVTASFGWRYDSTMPASARPNRSPIGFCAAAGGSAGRAAEMYFVRFA